MSDKKKDKSLVGYTALIFVVAILMIVLSFLSQLNLSKQQNAYTGIEGDASSITDKVSQLSDENMVLFETIRSLNKKLDEYTKEIENMEAETKELNSILENNKLLIQIQNYINFKQYDEAKELMAKLNFEIMSDEDTKMYSSLKKVLDKK